MTISTGNLIRSRNPGNAQSIIQSFLNDYLAAGYTNSPNNGVVFWTGSYPTRTVPSSVRAAADAVYAASGIFAPQSNQVSAALTESNIANVGGQLITATQGVNLTYPTSSAQAITGGTFPGFSQIFWGEVQRYLIYRRISATTTVRGNIPPAGTYNDSGKGLVTAANALNLNNITNPTGSTNLTPSNVISASTAGPISGYNATAFNTYWTQLMANWAAAYNAAGTISLTASICHGSCHSSCHGSRGRR